MWSESLDIITDSEMKARLVGVQYQMRQFSFLYGNMLYIFYELTIALVYIAKVSNYNDVIVVLYDSAFKIVIHIIFQE